MNKVCYYSFHLILCYPDRIAYSWTLKAISVLKNLILSVKKKSGRKQSVEPWIEFRRSKLQQPHWGVNVLPVKFIFFICPGRMSNCVFVSFHLEI